MTAEDHAHKKDPSWRQFEKLVARIQKQLAGNATVKWDDKLYGHISKTARQVDVSVRSRVAQFDMLVILSCKNYKRRIDVPHVEEFANTIKDVRANRGAMIASKGFTSAAKNVAQNYGIDLFTLLDASHNDWETYLALPVFYRNLGLGKYNFEVFSNQPLPLDFINDQRKDAVFYSNTGDRLGTANEIITHMWNLEQLPIEPGEHRVLLVEDGELAIRGVGRLAPVRAFADVTVVELLMFGYVPPEWAEGFRNEVTGALSPTKVEFILKSPEALERILRPIDDMKEIAVAPLKLGDAEIGVLVAESITKYGSPFHGGSQTEASLHLSISPRK